ncbi:flotillin family protein [Paenibacillus sp. SYP-B3998]|uniref:Flotillin family protein n=1 Tax=Paenibacillus sp. SYP-B3998 TaxID=2678564 RepID=A0A6G4A124_9BACL|nr:SPFH domain-containing protein [Paenibacillus sp. SYP-B3998]NEW07998.1 flotillin family protein [Paenibacillus sp. SYP-B3998]
MLTVLYAAGAIVFVVFILLVSIVKAYKKVPPNEAMIVYGLGGKRVVQGGGTFVIPGFQSYKTISMMLMSFDVKPDQPMFSQQGIRLKIEAVAQIKIQSDPVAIATASEQFLDHTMTERETIILHSVEGHLRGLVGQLTVEAILKNPDELNSKMRETCSEDLDKMGLSLISFVLKRVADDQGYIENLGVPEVERIRKSASIAKAEVERDIQMRQADTEKESAIRKAEAHQLRIEAESAASAKEAQYRKELSIKEAEFKQETTTKQAEADLAYELKQNQIKQSLMTEQVKIKQMEAEANKNVRQIEVELKQKELEATVIKPAEADKLTAIMRAEVSKQRQILEAEAEAESTRKRGEATAEAELAKGKANAEVIRLAGFAEAEALEKKAEAYKQYTQAAVTVEILRMLPELAEKIAAPLSKVDKITVISQDGATSGVNRITGDITKMIAQVPEIAQTLTGKTVTDLARAFLGKENALIPDAVGKETE